MSLPVNLSQAEKATDTEQIT